MYGYVLDTLLYEQCTLIDNGFLH